MIAAFAETARIAVEAGIDGVELHGTHGYLLQQSFSPWGNHRDDGWGERLAFGRRGDRAGAAGDRPRTRRSACGSRPTTSSPPERGGLGPDGLRGVAAGLAAARPPRLREPVRRLADGPLRAVDRQLPPSARRVPAARPGAAGRARGACPVIAASRINDPALAERALAAGDCDLVRDDARPDRRPGPRPQDARGHAGSDPAWARTRAASTGWSPGCRSRASTTPTSAARAAATRSRRASAGACWSSAAARPG